MFLKIVCYVLAVMQFINGAKIIFKGLAKNNSGDLAWGALVFMSGISWIWIASLG